MKVIKLELKSVTFQLNNVSFHRRSAACDAVSEGLRNPVVCGSDMSVSLSSLVVNLCNVQGG